MDEKGTKDTYNNIYNNNIYISLSKASELCDYSQEYLSLRARQGKLKAIKQGRNWVTTKDWVEKYLQNFSEKEIEEQIELEVKEKKVELVKKDPLPSDIVLKTPISDLTRPFFSFVGSVLKIIPRIIPALWGASLELFKSISQGFKITGDILPIIGHGLKDALEKIIDLGDFPVKQITPFEIKIPKIPKIPIPSFNINQPKFVITGILISSLILGSFLAFNPGARAALFQAGEGMADFIFKQSRDLVKLTQTTVEKTFETSSNLFNQMPQLIEEATQTIEELPIKIASKIAQVNIPEINIPEINIPEINIPQVGTKVLCVIPNLIGNPDYNSLDYRVKPDNDTGVKYFACWFRMTEKIQAQFSELSQKNEQFKNDLKFGLAQLPQKIKEFQVKAIEGQNQTAEIIKSLPDAIKILSVTWSQDARAWVEGIPEWTDKKISQAKTFALEVQNKGRSLFLKERLLSFSKNIFISSAESIAQGLTRFSKNMTATVSEISILGNETSQKVEGSVEGTIREIDKGLLGFVTVKDKVSANIFNQISNLNSELSQRITLVTSKTKETYGEVVDSLKTTQSKLGDTYLKVAEFLIPRYDIDWGVTRVQQQLVQTIQPIQSITQKITKQEVTQVTQVVESVDLTEIKKDIEDLKSKIATKINYTVPSYAPVYIPSSGLQVAGHSLLTSLNVSGSGAIGGSLSVRQSMTIGNTKDNIVPTLAVYADSTFYNGATFNSSLSAGSLGTGGVLTVGGNSTLATTTITGEFAVQDSEGNSRFYVQSNTGNLGIGTTSPTALLDISKTSGSTTGLFKISSSTDGDLLIVDSAGNLGIGTTTPDYKLSVVGGMFASTTSNQLTLGYDLATNAYSTFSIGSDGDLTIDNLNNATTTFTDALRVYRTAGGTENLFQVGTSTDDDMLVVKSNGNIGIGTTTPWTNLVVGKTSGIPQFDIGKDTQNFMSFRYDISTGVSYVYSYLNNAVSNLSLLPGGGNVGIGTTTPDYKLSVVGGMFASTTSNQLTLGYDLATNAYSTFSIGSDGDLTVDLATGNSTTTFNDNAVVSGNLTISTDSITVGTSDFQGNIFDSLGDLTIADNLQINGNATSTGSFYITGTATTTELFVQGAGHIGGLFSVDGASTFLSDITQTGNLNITGYASTTAGLFTLGEIRTASNLTSDGNFLVNGNATTTGSLNVDGDFLTDGTGSFANTKLTIDSNGNLLTTGYASTTTYLNTQGDSHIGGIFSVDGASTFLSDITQTGNLNITGYASTTAGLFTLGEIRTASNLTSDGNFLVNGNATTTGSMNIDGQLTVDGIGSFANTALTIDSSGNLITTGYASTTTAINTQGTGHFGEQVTIDGNLGIGNTGPTEKLTVRSSTASTTLISNVANFEHIFSDAVGLSNIGSGLLFSAEADDSSVVNLSQIASVFGNASSTIPQSDLRFYTRNEGSLAERMRITNDGNVG
ncbi:hypothetical protein KKG65_03385, partial [Patescibacteria group bacterium]|nr:hypothetical protein [Patescibacteria group bacterium]